MEKVYYKNEVLTLLNEDLIKQLNVSPEEVEMIKAYHTMKQAHCDAILRTNKREKIQKIADNIQRIEFMLQDLWGFKRNSNYHKFWNLPKCTCPKMDNEDRYPHGYYIINNSCIVHGF